MISLQNVLSIVFSIISTIIPIRDQKKRLIYLNISVITLITAKVEVDSNIKKGLKKSQYRVYFNSCNQILLQFNLTLSQNTQYDLLTHNLILIIEAFISYTIFILVKFINGEILSMIKIYIYQ